MYQDSKEYLSLSDVSGKLYVGENAGRYLLQEIQNARTSIKIVSPYLSPKFMEYLVECSRRGVDITLITTGSENGGAGGKDENIYSVLQQFKYLVPTLQRRKLICVGICIALIAFFAACEATLPLLNNEMWFIENPPLVILAFLLFPLLSALVIVLFFKKVRKMPIYEFVYESAFKMKIIKQTNYSRAIVHSKIYTIDEGIAYVGSLNFTVMGFEKNVESCFSIHDRNAITRMNNFIDEMFRNNDKYEAYSTEELSQMYFSEKRY